MPVRFTSPGLAGQTSSLLKKHQWQVDVAYRHLYADKWFVGTDVREDAAPFGHPLYLNIHSVDLGVEYGVTNKLSMVLTLPFSYGTHSRYYQDLQRHEVSSSGLGDISVVGNYWLRDPGKASVGNVAFGLGVKTPSGPNTVRRQVFLTNGQVLNPPVDQSIQLGDGGWGVIGQAQAFRQIYRRLSGYTYEWYLLSPKEMTNVPSPIKALRLSVPDVYSVRVGASYLVLPKRGLSLSFGSRVDGIRVKDLVGGHDGFRRPGYTLYMEPGVAIGRGLTTFTLSVPFRVHQDFKRGPEDAEYNFAGGGDLANTLVLAGYSVRF
jgi:hypothetical protein